MLTTSTSAAENNNQPSSPLGETKLPFLSNLAQTIVLVRHGKSAGNVLSHRPQKDFYLPHGMTDETLPLTDRGKAQASKTGEWLSKNYPEGFDVIISSPFLRAKETAEFACIAARWDVVNIIFEPLAVERDWGVFLDVHTGQQRDFNDVLRRDRRGGRIPGGESLDETRARAHDFLRKLHSEYEGKRILVFTHGEFIQECIAAALEELGQPTDLAFGKKPRNCQVFELSLNSTPFDSIEEECRENGSLRSGKSWRLQTFHPSGETSPTLPINNRSN
jgi:broad specificity phosphatase PhoE